VFAWRINPKNNETERKNKGLYKNICRDRLVGEDLKRIKVSVKKNIGWRKSGGYPMDNQFW
jgi:hypothetical protein